MKPIIKSAALKSYAIIALIAASVVQAYPVRAEDAVGAWKLYGQKQYDASANAFEKVFKTAKPEARLYYYAGLANTAARRNARAKQLFDYVIANFAGTPEAELAKTASGCLTPTGTTTAGAKPDGTASSPANKATSSSSAVATLGSSAAASGPKTVRKKGAFVFTPEDIAREGANGIDQTDAPNCWFECGMSALAQLPKGQRMLARMITYGDGDSYVVRFPGDGKEYKITKADLEEEGVKCTALWASLLDYAQRKKFPNNAGAEGTDGNMSRLHVGLSCITGCRTDVIHPGHSNNQELASFIYSAVSSGNPITAGTANRIGRRTVPVFECHAYTITGFDPARNMITIRNPHGHKSHQFTFDEDPRHLQFEPLEDGVFKMHMDLFRESYGSLCRSFI
ncbi:hypothetical protein KBI23_06545 [bacterium]|nr:hypothetical protein [bacterium]MBP9807118.1 hypothetical protein [bacterium]